METAIEIVSRKVQRCIEAKRFPMRIEGHRGAGHLEPENSLKAFKKAIELGIDGVEFDVWLTKDHVPVVVHGLRGGIIEFEGDIKLIINEIDSNDLKKYFLKNGEKIPTLVEVLDVCKDQVHLNIEIKEPKEEAIERVVALVETRNMWEQITFSSFNHYLREKLTQIIQEKKIEAQVTFGFLMKVTKPIFPSFHDLQPGDSINIDIRYLEKSREDCLARIKQAQERNVQIKFWFPMEYIDEHMFYDDLISLNVHTIITNKPIAIIEYFAQTICIA